MASMITDRPGSGKAVLSIDVEDWFHAANLNVSREAWERCELRVERNTMRMIEVLGARNARATFFVLGWVAEKCPRLVREIAAAGEAGVVVGADEHAAGLTGGMEDEIAEEAARAVACGGIEIEAVGACGDGGVTEIDVDILRGDVAVAEGRAVAAEAAERAAELIGRDAGERGGVDEAVGAAVARPGPAPGPQG